MSIIPSRADELNTFYTYGFSFGPLKGKYPLSPNGLKDFTDDPAQIKAWQQQYRTCNWGVRQPGVIALDIDTRHGGTLESLTVDVSTTLAVKTGGGGWHVYYRHAGPTRGKLDGYDGIDIKAGHSGYTVAPGSIHPDTGQAYTILHNPGVIASLPDHLRAAVEPAKPMPAVMLKSSVPLNESGLIETVLNAVEGTRNRALFWALHRARENGANAATVEGLRHAALSIGLHPAEIERTVKSALGQVAA